MAHGITGIRSRKRQRRRSKKGARWSTGRPPKLDHRIPKYSHEQVVEGFIGPRVEIVPRANGRVHLPPAAKGSSRRSNSGINQEEKCLHRPFAENNNFRCGYPHPTSGIFRLVTT
jgi:hypothetical protein